ncbi:Meiotic coiled-coil protein 2 [Serendipita indica DSM 11827]|nr:Meiotic coiled-coil protein 2 [Serendipita indica DSM 11827]
MSTAAEVEALSYSPSSMSSNWNSSRGASVGQQSGLAMGALQAPSSSSSSTLRRPLATTNSNTIVQNAVSSNLLHSQSSLKPLELASSMLGDQNSVAAAHAHDVRKQSLGSLATRPSSKMLGPLNGAAVGAIGDGRRLSSPQTVHDSSLGMSEIAQAASVLRTLALTPPTSMSSTFDATKNHHDNDSYFRHSPIYPFSHSPSHITPLSQPLVTSPANESGGLSASSYHQLDLSLNANPYDSLAFDSRRPSLASLQNALFGHSLADISQGVSLPASSPTLSSPTTLGLGDHAAQGMHKVQHAPLFNPSKSHQGAPYHQSPSRPSLASSASSSWSLPQAHATGSHSHPSLALSSTNDISRKIGVGPDDWVSSAPVNVDARYPADGNSIYHPLANTSHSTWIHDSSYWSTDSNPLQGLFTTAHSSNQPASIMSLPTPITSPRDSASSASDGFDKLDTLPSFILGTAGLPSEVNLAQHPLLDSPATATFGAQSSIPWDPTTQDRIAPSPAYVRPRMATVLNASPNHSDSAGSSYALPLRLLDSQHQAVPTDDDEALNFLQLLQPNSKPPYHVLVHRIVKRSDQQASIFIQQKLKNAHPDERARIVSAIAERGLEMMQGRFGNWCVQRCLESPCTKEERMKVLACMIGHVVELATNCYGTHVVQKALECEEEFRRVIVTELLNNDPAYTLTSKHCSHVWAKVMELSWVNGPPPPIFSIVNRSLRGKWATLACHETGSLVVQTMFENMDDAGDTLVIVDEILNNLEDVVKTQFGAFVVQHIIEHGDSNSSQRTTLSLINGLAVYGTHDIAVKSILKLLKEKNPITVDAIISKMCEPNVNGTRQKRPIIVDLALSTNGSQIIQAVLPEANKEQRARLYDAVKGHTVTLRGCKTGSRVIWLFDRMRAYYGY